MDTRRKILSRDSALGLPGPLAVVTGYFDILRAGHVRKLDQVRSRTAGLTLLVVVATHPGVVLAPAARVEMVAALRMVDYVVTADDDDLDAFIERLRPAQLARFEKGDLVRTRRLIDDAQRSQTR